MNFKAWIIVFISPLFAFAELVYVTDIFEITMRQNPNIKSKIVAIPKSGQVFQAGETQNGWTKVNFTKRGEPVEGWVLSRYLIRRTPYQKQVGELQNKFDKIKAEVILLRKKWGETSSKEKKYFSELTQANSQIERLTKDYSELKEGAATYVELKQKFDNMKSDLDSITNRAGLLQKEKDTLAAANNAKWFVAGAATLGVGLIVGLLFGLREKRRRRYY